MNKHGDLESISGAFYHICAAYNSSFFRSLPLLFAFLSLIQIWRLGLELCLLMISRSVEPLLRLFLDPGHVLEKQLLTLLICASKGLERFFCVLLEACTLYQGWRQVMHQIHLPRLGF